MIPLNSPAYYAPYNGAIEHTQRKLNRYIKDWSWKTETPEGMTLLAELSSHDHNHLPRKSLRGQNSCSAYFDGPRAFFDKRKRKEVFLWIKQVASDMLEKLGDDAGGKAMQSEINNVNDKATNKQLVVIIGDINDIHLSLGDIIEDITKDEYRLRIMTASAADELWQLARKNAFDIFIPIMNNIIGVAKSAAGLQLIKDFKAEFHKPIIAISGYYTGPSFLDDSKKAGADYAFILPYSGEEIAEAINGCLAILNKKNILVVDDCEGPRDSIRMLLKPFYNVYTEEDSFEALRKIQDAIIHFELIITDIGRPGMSGIEMVKKIREKNVTIPIIIVSGHCEKGVPLLEKGLVSACIPKPYNSNEIKNIVSRVLADNLKIRKKNILYVDDDQDCRDLIENILTSKEYGVTTAENGMDGLVKLEEKRNYFDLIITGITMPGMSGADMIRIIRKELQMKVPIIVLTGRSKEKFYKYLNEGAWISAWIPKPFNISELLNTVEMVLQCPE